MDALGPCEDTDIQAILGKCAAIVVKFSRKRAAFLLDE